MTRKALGRGIEALFDVGNLDENYGSVVEIPHTKIVSSRHQPREIFNNEKLEELAQSIKTNGVIQPIIVKSIEDKYEIIAGERRYRACKIAGVKNVPAIVKDVDNEKALRIALIENIQREDLNAIEEANAYKELLSITESHNGIAEIVGKNRSTITNSLRLLKLPSLIQEYLIQGKLSSGHCRALLSIKSEKKIVEVAQNSITNFFNVRQLENYIKNLKSSIKTEKTKKLKIKKIHIIKNLENKLTRKFKSKVRVSNNINKGKIEIIYASKEELERIIDCLDL